MNTLNKFEHGQKLFEHGQKIFEHGQKLFEHGQKLFEHGQKIFKLVDKLDMIAFNSVKYFCQSMFFSLNWLVNKNQILNTKCQPKVFYVISNQK